MNNKWIFGAIPAVAIHLSIGSAYAFSTLTIPLMAQMDAPETTIKWAFSIAIFFLGISAASLGKFVQDYGPRVSARIAGCCFAAGMMGSGFAVVNKSVVLLFVCYGLIGGVGLGTGYITPVKTLIQWFYDRKGLATGLAVCGFGGGSMIAGPAFAALIDAFSAHDAAGKVVAYNVAPMFFTMGAIYGVMMIGASFLIRTPPPEWGQVLNEQGEVVERQRQYGIVESVKTPHFWAIWIMMFINISVGIAIIYTASPLMQREVGASPQLAAILAVSGVSAFNALGRLGWASASDRFGRSRTFTTFFMLQIVAFGALGLLLTGNQVPMAIFLVLIYAIATCYGGGFATLPAFLSDMFGNKNVSAIHGLVLTAWAMAGLAGPSILVWAKGDHEDYQKAMFYYLPMIAVALFVSILLLVALRRSKGGFDPLHRD